MLKVHVPPDSFNLKDAKAFGGEADIYQVDQLAFKIFRTPFNVQKIKELSVLDRPEIIRPIDLIYSEDNRVIGYTMRWSHAEYTICHFFTEIFKEQIKISDDKLIGLLREFQKLISYIHSKGIIVVDLNELNFLVPKSCDKVFAIDVTSYQTPNHPCTAIMPSVRDYQAKTFTENSDWFSWGVLACQMLGNVHPYSGTHPDYKGKKAVRLERRMRDNVSIFSRKTSLPDCERLSRIPTGLKKWMQHVFEKGERCPPPSEYGEFIKISPPVRKSGKFNITPSTWQTKKYSNFGRIIYQNRYHYEVTSHRINLIKDSHGVVRKREVAQFSPYFGRIKNHTIMTSMSGKHFLSLLYGESHQKIEIVELLGYNLIDWKFEDGILIAVGAKGNQYDRIICKFSGWSYTSEIEPDVTYKSVNFCGNHHGIFVLYDGKQIIVFSKNSSAKASYPAFGEIELCSNFGEIGFWRENKYHKLSLKKES